ncbi:small ribosomal subunit protein mS39 [Linepithema humile]|uniref:small ribosomal subunit protein mS39 n=1 Tax=Linepithema humile TaxID=83485 RepID=UPI0006239457|nr:PREDICTED: protein PTCD3 homolog, mitochondrial [Linepithema humile]
MNSLARISRRKLYKELMIRLQSTTATSSSSSEIHIPNRIERGPTDILKALEKTISRDYTAPHYKFHDDPYLTPLSKMHERNYALAKESGKKAAMWIREEHRDLFDHKLAEPEIQAFVPPPIYTEESKVTEETLLYEISNANVANSITIYDLLKGEVTVSTKQILLELLCFYNNSKPTSMELLETRWYQLNQKHKKNIWISRPQIDALFQFLKQQEPSIAGAAYSAMICGLAKFFSVEKAWQLYTECQENKIVLSIDAHNAVIWIVPLLRQGEENSNTLLTDVYQTITSSGITPNIDTFNAVLNLAATFQASNFVKAAMILTRSTLADINKFELKPSLTTYYYLLRILRKFGDTSYGNFVNIMTSLKNETLTIQDAKDLDFFGYAMEIALRQFCKREAGEMVNELLLTGENYKFIGDNLRENVYYRFYLELILATEELETFFKVYNKLVPHVTIPEPHVINAILEALQLHPAETATQYIPKLWSHMVMFGHLNVEGLLENILQLISVHCKPASDSPLNAQFAEIAVTIWNHVQTQNTKRVQHIIMTHTSTGNMIVLLLRGNNFDKAMEVLSLLINSPHLITGTITTDCIDEIFEICLAQAHVPMIFTLLEYVTSCNLIGAEEMAKKLYKTVSLTSTQKNILISLVGNVLQFSDEN